MNLGKQLLAICLGILFAKETSLSMGYPINDRSLQAQEYVIYDAVIKRIFVENVPEEKRIDLLVIQERTILQDKAIQGLRDGSVLLSRNVASVDEATLEDLEARNKEPQSLSSLFSIPMNYTIVGTQELKNSFGGSSDASEAWKRFYRRYPNSSGLIGLSRVGFNGKKNQALVLLERSCGPECADGQIVLLSKENNVWAVRQVLTLWVV